MFSKDVRAFWSFDYVCFLPPRYAMEWIEVFDFVNTYESHIWDTDVAKVVSLLD